MAKIELSPQDRADFPIVGTEEWDTMNARRCELIDKKIDQGYDSLSIGEKAEYERLQRLSQQALEQAYPSPFVDDSMHWVHDKIAGGTDRGSSVEPLRLELPMLNYGIIKEVDLPKADKGDNMATQET